MCTVVGRVAAAVVDDNRDRGCAHIGACEDASGCHGGEKASRWWIGPPKIPSYVRLPRTRHRIHALKLLAINRQAAIGKNFRYCTVLQLKHMAWLMKFQLSLSSNTTTFVEMTIYC